MKTSSCKAKGRRLCAKIKERLHHYFPSLEDADLTVTPSGVNGPDVQMSPKARDLFPYSIEAKNTERLNIWKALEQAEGHQDNITDPLLVFSRNRSKEYAVVELDRFIELVAALEGFRRD